MANFGPQKSYPGMISERGPVVSKSVVCSQICHPTKLVIQLIYLDSVVIIIMAEIEWPWQYSFPPFFTLQPHAETKAKQLSAWKSLVLDYYRATKEATIDVREIHASPLFNNTAIKRKLSPEVVSLILEDLAKSGNASPLDKTKQRWLVHWHTLQEWGDIIYNWAQDKGLSGSVCTLFELTQGEDTVDQDFHGLDNEVLIRSLRILEADGKAELIMFDDNQGVKFF